MDTDKDTRQFSPASPGDVQALPWLIELQNVFIHVYHYGEIILSAPVLVTQKLVHAVHKTVLSDWDFEPWFPTVLWLKIATKVVVNQPIYHQWMECETWNSSFPWVIMNGLPRTYRIYTAFWKYLQQLSSVVLWKYALFRLHGSGQYI